MAGGCRRSARAPLLVGAGLRFGENLRRDFGGREFTGRRAALAAELLPVESPRRNRCKAQPYATAPRRVAGREVPGGCANEPGQRILVAPNVFTTPPE